MKNIRYEEPSQRRTFRVNAPMNVIIDGTHHQAINWSVLDFRVENYNGAHKEGDEISVRVDIPYQGFGVQFNTTTRITMIDKQEKSLAGEFIDLDERKREILSTFVSGLIRGEMDSVDGVIRRMDIPVTPASLRSDTPITPEAIKEAEHKRMVGSIVYMLLGLIFSAALIIVIYTNFFQIKIKTAVLTSPADIIMAPTTGNLGKQLVSARERTTTGTQMLEFIDPKLEQDIQRAALKLEEAIVNNADKDKNARLIMKESDLITAKAAVKAQRNNLSIQASKVSRLRKMISKGLARKLDLENAQSAYYRAQAALNTAMQRLSGVTQQQGNLQATLLSLAEGEYNLLVDQRNRLKIAAPADGRIISYMVREGGAVRYGDPIAVFQHDGPKYVEAYLTREEALSIAIGDKTSVYFPSHDHKTSYYIVDIDYASKLVTKRDGHYVMEQAGKARDVLVRLEQKEGEESSITSNVTAGTSVVIVFDKPMWR